MKPIIKLKKIIKDYHTNVILKSIFDEENLKKLDRQFYKDIALEIAEIFNSAESEPYCSYPIDCMCCFERFAYRKELEKKILEFLKK